MNLSARQLSELVNVRFGTNFCRYIREQRVEPPKKLLASEPKSSVLAIGLETGFKNPVEFLRGIQGNHGYVAGSVSEVAWPAVGPLKT